MNQKAKNKRSGKQKEQRGKKIEYTVFASTTEVTPTNQQSSFSKLMCSVNRLVEVHLLMGIKTLYLRAHDLYANVYFFVKFKTTAEMVHRKFQYKIIRYVLK